MEEKNVAVVNNSNAALNVTFELQGRKIEIDGDFVKKYLVRGKSEMVTAQEVLFFLNTCRAQNLNPLANGEVYLIKYSKEEPAQLVVGKDKYLSRAYLNPNYMSKEDGIIVSRGSQIIQKKGCCLYPNEVLIGGWCRVFYMKGGTTREAYKEVALQEYNKGMANWKSKPATMINKVAVSQCVRDAFPQDYCGLYSEDEMIAAGAIPPEIPPAQKEIIVSEDGRLLDEDGNDITEQGTTLAEEGSDEDRVITQEERKALFRKGSELFQEDGNDIIRQIMDDLGIESTAKMTVKDYLTVLEGLEDEKQMRDHIIDEESVD